MYVIITRIDSDPALVRVAATKDEALSMFKADVSILCGVVAEPVQSIDDEVLAEVTRRLTHPDLAGMTSRYVWRPGTDWVEQVTAQLDAGEDVAIAWDEEVEGDCWIVQPREDLPVFHPDMLNDWEDWL